MKNRFLFCVGMLLLPFFGKGQEVDTAAVRMEVDSLVKVSRVLAEERKYDEALQIIAKAEEVALTGFGQNSAEFGTCLHNHGKILFNKGDHNLAENYLQNAITVREKALGKEHPDYVNSLNHLAYLYLNGGIYNRAESLYLEIIKIQAKNPGKEHIDYITSLKNLASLYFKSRNYDKAELRYLEIIEIQTKLLGKEHKELGKSMNALAYIYLIRGKFDYAEPLYLKIIAINEKTLGKDNPTYATSLYNLAKLYLDKGDYVKAEPLLLTSKQIHEMVSNKDDVDLALSLGGLGRLYYNLGETDKAEPYAIKSMEIRKKVLGENDSEYGRSLILLADIYWGKSQYDKSIVLGQEAIKVFEKSLGKFHPNYAMGLIKLATSYTEMGEYEKARPLFLEAKSIHENELKKSHPQYPWLIDCLGVFYSSTGDYVKAIEYHLKALSLCETANQKNSVTYAEILMHLGIDYYLAGENDKLSEGYDKSLAILLQATRIVQKLEGRQSANYASAITNLANVYSYKDDHDKAIPFYLEAKSIWGKIQGTESPEYGRSLKNLGDVYWNKRDYPLAARYLLSTNSETNALREKVLSYSTNEEMLNYLSTIEKRFHSFLSFIQDYSSDSLVYAAYDNSLNQKHSLLDAAIALNKGIVRADSSTQAIYGEFKSLNLRINKLLNVPISIRNDTLITDLKKDIYNYEKELIRRSPAFVESRLNVNWKVIQKTLRLNDASIEFVDYRKYTPDPTDTILYAALLLLPNDSTPHFIPLCEQRQLDAIISSQGENPENFITQLYASPRSDGQASLYQLIWQPIDKILRENGVKTVYYAPSGLLHRINLAAIAYGRSGSTLSDSFQLVQLGSTRKLVNRTVSTAIPTSALIYGGLFYDMDSTAIAKANLDLSATAQDTTGGLFRNAVYEPESKQTRSGGSRFLAGTDREARYLYKLLTKRNISATMRLGYYGTEESVKQIGLKEPSPGLLHFGTHGFFFPDPADTLQSRFRLNQEAPVFKMSEHPLIRSGLRLSGSDYAWYNKHPMPGMEDGILTAYEVSQLDLSNTELVVLSACETGLGDIKGNEGVYGLQRAFRIAGAKNVLMSLWEVPDEATEILMTQFYNNWLTENMSLRRAFEEAQQWLRRQKGFESPHKWAGFVLLGE